MALEIEDLGTMEIHLEWIVVFRILLMLLVPLFAALLFGSIIIKVILWGITALIFFTSVKAWGHSVIAIIFALVPLYVYFEWEKAPGWLAYAVGVLVVFEIFFLNNRIKEIRALNRQVYENEES